MKLSAIATLALLLAIPACGEDQDDTDSDAATAATEAATEAATDATAGTDATATAGTDASMTDATTTDAPTTGEPTTGSAGLSFATDVWAPIIQPNCGCHAASPSGGLLMGMDAASSFASMVGVPSMNGMPFVTAGDPENSYVLHKMRGTQVDAGGAGSQMPLGAPALDAATLDAVEAWILDGAKE